MKQPIAYRLTNTSYRKPRYEYFDTKEEALTRQADFNRSVDDGGLHNLIPLYDNFPDLPPSYTSSTLMSAGKSAEVRFHFDNLDDALEFHEKLTG